MPSRVSERRKKARELFRRRVRRALDQAEEAFEGQYTEELEGLLGLSRAEINAISPGVTGFETYDRLIAVVKEASRVNLAQADLVNRIRGLGDLAVSIAKRVPSLGTLL
jgi:hypothetical protein